MSLDSIYVLTVIKSLIFKTLDLKPKHRQSNNIRQRPSDTTYTT